MTTKVPAEALSAVSETMLATLYSHAAESRRPDGLIRDPRAEDLVARIDYDFVSRQMDADDQSATCLRLRQFDRFAQAFLAAHPDGVVVHIGCGLDTRFDRVDNDQVTWYDLDLPPVIELRRRLLEETPRYRMIASSALDLAWLDSVDVHPGKPFLFIAEGVFMYFPDAEMQRLVSALRKRFPGAELVFDVASPLIVGLQNLSLALMKADFRMRWSLRRYDALEQWAPGIRLLEAWYYTSIKENIPRLQNSKPCSACFRPLARGWSFCTIGWGRKREGNMPETTNLSGVAETLLITLYIRATESQRPDALIKDERAEALVRRLDPETLRKTLALTEDSGRAVLILKGRDFDRFAQDFMMRHQDAVVVHMGCGLDTRFERVDNGRVEWYDLDLPDVIALRRKLVGGESTRHHFLACSVLESGWMDTVSARGRRPSLFLAEGLFMYFEEAQVKSLVLSLKEHFPGAELVFDAYSPFMRWAHNLRIARKRIGARLHWDLKDSRDLEEWGSASYTGAGIRLLDERFPFQYPEASQRRTLRVRLVPFLVAKGIGVFRYQLGNISDG